MAKFVERQYRFQGDFGGDRMKCFPEEKATMKWWLRAQAPGAVVWEEETSSGFRWSEFKSSLGH